MGQGVLTSLPQLVADELDADWNVGALGAVPGQPGLQPARYPDHDHRRLLFGAFSWEPLRKAGATARAMLVAAAAREWGVDPATLRTENSMVIAPDGRRLRYGELAAQAMKLPVPAEVKLKDPKAFKIIGQPVKRLDTPEKVKAEAIFGIDVTLPGMLTGVVVRSPAFGAQVASMNCEKAKAAPGVKAVVPISTGIVVVGDTYWNARKAAELLQVQWGEGTLVGRSSAELRTTLEEAAKLDGIVARKEGEAGSQRPVKTVTAKYHLPYLAHAAMEPMTCTASVKADGVEVWVGTQAQTAVQQNAAAIAGLKPEQVKVHTTFLGGGFGRRAAQDFVNAAVEASKAVGAPVKVIYSREDDMRGAYYRPISYTEITGGLDEKGEAVMLSAKVVVPSLAEATGFRRLIREDGVDRVAVEGLADMPYQIPELRVNWVKHDFGIPIWFWRSVGRDSQHLCHRDLHRRDGARGRCGPLSVSPQAAEQASSSSGGAGSGRREGRLGQAAARGRGRGIAVVECFGGWTAEVAEVSIENGQPRVHRVVCAVDCGTVVNPQQVEAQMQSAIVYALSAALYGHITFKDGKVEQGNFDDYPVMRMAESPRIEVYIVPSAENPGGVGEPGTPTAAPAVANAIFALTGKRIRDLPFSQHDLGAG